MVAAASVVTAAFRFQHHLRLVSSDGVDAGLGNSLGHVEAIMEYLANHNENPRPFVWTANADLILERVKKVCERISNSGH